MEIKKNLVSSSKYKIKCPYEMKPEYVTFHNTDNNAPAKNEVAYMIRNDREVSFHVAVDDVEAIQGIPFNRNAWHCGDGKGNGNRNSIGVEICYNALGKNDPKFKKSEENAVEVCAQLLKQFGLGIDRLKPHKHWSGKNCPSTTNHNDFIERVKNKMNNVSTSNGKDLPKGSYTGRKGRVNTNELNVRYDRWVGNNEPKIVGTLKKGDIVNLQWCENNWISIDGFKGNQGLGYIRSKFIDLI